MSGASGTSQFQPATRSGAGGAEGAVALLAGRVMLLWGWKRIAALFVSGGLAALIQAPFDFFAAGFIAFPMLVWLLDGAAGDVATGRLRKLRHFFAAGWWFGFGYFVAGLWWVGNAMLVDLERYAWALPIAVLLLPAAMAVFYGLAAAIARPFWGEGIGRIAALAAAFAVVEWLRGFVLTGFPWNAVGYGAMPVPVLMQSVVMVGMTGINALAVFVFALPAALASSRRGWLPILMVIAVAALHAGFGTWRIGQGAVASGETLAVRVVQPSIAQSDKWRAEDRDRIFRTYLDLSGGPAEAGAADPRLILWPETSVPFLLGQRPDALAALGELIEPGQVLLAGAVRMEGDSPSDPATRYYNSVVAVDDDGTIYDAADKLHLVPLGEFVPFERLLARFGITKIVELPGGFSAGTSRRIIEVADGIRVAPFICYEVIFPGLVAREAAGADIVVNVTNDAWFGVSPGPYQHLRQAQVRAVEAGLPMLRAANNGVSAIIDPFGRVNDALELDGVGILDAEVALDKAQPNPPVRADLAGWSLVALLALWALLGRVGRRTSAN